MIGFIAQLIGAYIATVAAALTVEIPKTLLYKCGFVGALGYFIFLLINPLQGGTTATLLAGIGIAALSQAMARIFRAPVSMFYIPGFFPLVPGIGVYRTAFYSIHNQPDKASQYLVESILISGAIALSIFLVESFMEMHAHYKQKKSSTH